MKLVLFFLCLVVTGCKDNLTLNQIEWHKQTKISIYIEGHINKPGLYLVEESSTINDVIKMAQGYKNNAKKLNNIKLKDKMKIFVNSNKVTNKININQANLTQLTTLKGIGESTALKIINYRKTYGDFKSISDLKKIKGIKDKLFTKIYEYICI